MHQFSTTCGVFLIHSGNHLGMELLICHPTGADDMMWSIPKGLPENGEEELQAALRECRKETGVDVESVSSSIHPMGKRLYRTKKKELCGFFAVCKERPTQFCCSSFSPQGKPEVDLIVWTPIAVAINLIHESQRSLLVEFVSNCGKGEVNVSLGLENIGKLSL